MTKTEANTIHSFDHRASLGKLMFLAIIAVALCSFGPLSIFAPVPLILAFLLYGRMTTLFLGIISTAVLWFVSMKFAHMSFFLVGIYFVAFLYAVLVAEVIFRNLNPVTGLIRAGLVLVTISGVSLFWYNQLGKVSIKAQLSSTIEATFVKLKENNKELFATGGEDARAVQDVLARPQDLANEVYSILPAIVFIGAFLGLWVSFYMTLRNSLIWRYKNLYTYSLKDLIQFKAPEFLVYPLITSLILMVGADYGLGKVASVVGGNVLYCLGVFYLFQGFGIYNDFLKYLRIRGFVKTLFVVFTLVMAFKFLAIIGMFDLWFNFRQYLKNTNNNNETKGEGDIK
jgi:hypothetical protein